MSTAKREVHPSCVSIRRTNSCNSLILSTPLKPWSDRRTGTMRCLFQISGQVWIAARSDEEEDARRIISRKPEVLVADFLDISTHHAVIDLCGSDS